MDPVADVLYKQTLRGPVRQWVNTLEILDGTNGDVLATLHTGLSGDITIERQKVRRRFNLNIAATSDTDIETAFTGERHQYGQDGDRFGTMGGYYGPYPREILEGLLIPGRNEVRVTRFLSVFDRWVGVGLGVFRISAYKTVDDGTSVTVTVSGQDRSSRISKNRWIEPYTATKGQPYTSEIRRALQNRWAECPMEIPDLPNRFINGQIVFGLEAENDPWEDIQGLAKSVGHELFFDNNGVATMRPLPDPSAQPPLDVLDEGSMDLKVTLSRELTDEQVYNGVVVTSDNLSVTGEPIRAVVWDERPESPTYYLGPFGKRPYFFPSNLVTTQAQAVQTAQSILQDVVGYDEIITTEIAQYPPLDVSDVLELVRPKSNVNHKYVAESIRIPIEYQGTQTVTWKRSVNNAD